MSREEHRRWHHEREAHEEGGAAEWQERALKDANGIEESVRKMANRKATRIGDVPAELWKILLCKREIHHPFPHRFLSFLPHPLWLPGVLDLPLA